jgi:uncharacterized coiled-coil protein SlyX
METRLVELEVRYSYMERAVADLNAVVLELRTELERLQKQLVHLQKTAVDPPPPLPEGERPPHY